MSFLQLIYVTAASLCAISLVSAADFGNVKGPQGQPSFNPNTYSGAGGNTSVGTGAPIGSATLSVGTATDSGSVRSGGSQSTPTVAPPGGQSIANADITDSIPAASTDDCRPPESVDTRQSAVRKGAEASGPCKPNRRNGGSSSSGGDLVDAAVLEVN
jgi:hypothetical protein